MSTRGSGGLRPDSFFQKLAFRVSPLFPNDPNLWAFHGAFEGNTKYLFLWLTLHRPGIRAVWISRSRRTEKLVRAAGGKVCFYPLPAACKTLAAARYHFVSHRQTGIPFRSKKSRVVCLWHGAGIKTIGLNRDRSKPSGVTGSIFEADYFVAGSKKHAQRFAESFAVPLDHCPVLGTPRLDCAFDGQLGDRARRAGSLDRSGFRSVYLYAPTWRESGRPFLKEALPEPGRLAAALAAQNAVLYVKLHPATLRLAPDTAWLAEMSRNHDCIRAWPAAVDFYTAINEIDCLVTDYSSIFADFIYVKDRGLVLYPFDLAAYQSRDRPFHFDYDEIGGARATGFDDLCRLIQSGLEPAPDPSLIETRREFWDDHFGIASPTIADYFTALAGRAHTF